MNIFLDRYINNLKYLLENINLNTIEDIIKTLEDTINNSSKVYILGNGGSCATASHMANDLGTGLKRRNVTNFDIISLGDNSAILTALANDIGFENVFYAQLKDILRPDDVLVAISCSGNSPNIIKSVEYAREIGSKVIGLTGFDGGKLKQMSDVNLHIETKKGEYGLVEDCHMILNHILFSYYKNQAKR